MPPPRNGNDSRPVIVGRWADDFDLAQHGALRIASGWANISRAPDKSESMSLPSFFCRGRTLIVFNVLFAFTEGGFGRQWMLERLIALFGIVLGGGLRYRCVRWVQYNTKNKGPESRGVLSMATIGICVFLSLSLPCWRGKVDQCGLFRVFFLVKTIYLFCLLPQARSARQARFLSSSRFEGKIVPFADGMCTAACRIQWFDPLCLMFFLGLVVCPHATLYGP